MEDIVERAGRLGVSVEVIERKQFGVNAGSMTAFDVVLPDATRVAFSSEADLRAGLLLAERVPSNPSGFGPVTATNDAPPAAADLLSAAGRATAMNREISGIRDEDEAEEPAAFADHPAVAPDSSTIQPQSAASGGLSFAERQAQRMQNRPSVGAQTRTPNVKSPIVAQGRTLV